MSPYGEEASALRKLMTKIIPLGHWEGQSRQDMDRPGSMDAHMTVVGPPYTPSTPLSDAQSARDRFRKPVPLIATDPNRHMKVTEVIRTRLGVALEVRGGRAAKWMLPSPPPPEVSLDLAQAGAGAPAQGLSAPGQCRCSSGRWSG